MPFCNGASAISFTVLSTTLPPIAPSASGFESLSLTVTPIVDPAPGGNCCFSYDPPSACGELDVTYEGLLNFEPLQPTTYDWDFGNGNTGTGATPAAENYNNPGDYYPELTTTVYNYVLTDVNVTASGSGWCGDIEEVSLFGVCQGAPDLFFDYANDGVTYTSSEGSDNLTTSWSNLGIELNSLLFSLTFLNS